MESTVCCDMPHSQIKPERKKGAVLIRILGSIRILGAEEMSKTK